MRKMPLIALLALLPALAQADTVATYDRDDFPSGRPPERLMAPRSADSDTFEEVHSTSNALDINDVTGSVDVVHGVTVVEQGQFDMEFVGAGATDQVCGVTGGTGDFLHEVVIVPLTTSPTAVSIKDGSGTSRTIFAGGASSVTDLKPFVVPLNVPSTAGAWSVTTGATTVTALCVGRFTP